MAGAVWFGDNLEYLRNQPSESVQLIYIDPPFNTGTVQRLQAKKSRKSSKGSVGFGGQKYEHTIVSDIYYKDVHSDYISGFLAPRLIEAHRILQQDGTLYLHLDMREVHYAKVFLDSVFSRDCFLNEIIWSYDFGGRGKRCWPKKHDNILVYAKDPKRHVFNWDDIDRVPYLAPDLVGGAKAARGKVPTDVWWQTIVPTNSKERTGYPTQKPIQLASRIVRASSSPGGRVLDFFAGSGTVGEAAEKLGRDWDLVDSNEAAISVMKERFASTIPGASVSWNNVNDTSNKVDNTNEQEDSAASAVQRSEEGDSSG